MATEQNENNDVTGTNVKEGKNEDETIASDEDPKEGTSKSQDEAQPQQSPSRPASPEACSICLGKVENKSFTDSCFHTFCFVCLMEWSKVKAVCPLCKQPFKSIIHNVRSFEDYDQYDLRNNNAADSLPGMNSARFRYSTTLTTQRLLERQIREQERQIQMLQRPSRTNARVFWRTRRQAATAAFRKTVYSTGMRVTDVRTACGRSMRYRQISPAFFSRNTACSHRLVPWLNRELNVLLHNNEDNVHFLLELVLDLIKRFDVQSEEFAEHVRSFLGRRTEQFVHEFYMFARSPYDMIAYDEHAVYDVTNDNAETHEISSSDNSPDNPILQVGSVHRTITADDRVIVLNSDDEEDDDIQIESVAGPSGLNNMSNDMAYQLSYLSSSPLLSRVHNLLSSSTGNSITRNTSWDDPPIEILDNDTSAVPAFPSTSAVVYIAEEERTRNPIEKSSLNIPLPSVNKSSVDDAIPSTSNNMAAFVSTVQADDMTDQTDDAQENNSVITENGHVVKVKHEKKTPESEWENGSDIVIIGYDKPWEERSPIPLSSAEEEIILMKTKPATPKRRVKTKTKTRSRSRSSSTSSSSSRSSSSSSSRRRKKKSSRRRTRSKSTTRTYNSYRRCHRSRSHSPSAFGDHRRRQRRSRSARSSRSHNRRSKRTRSRSHNRRSRSRSNRYSRSVSRYRRHSRSVSRSRKPSRSRYSRSRSQRRHVHSPRRSRSPRRISVSPARRHSRSPRRRSRSPRRFSRSPHRRRSRSPVRYSKSRRHSVDRRQRSISPLERRKRRKSRSLSVRSTTPKRYQRRRKSNSSDDLEYTALGRYFDTNNEHSSRRYKKKADSSSYTAEWIQSNSRHHRRDSSVESINSNVSAFQRHHAAKKRHGERRTSIEVVYDSRGISNNKERGSSKTHKSKRKRKDRDNKRDDDHYASQIDNVVNGGSSVDYRMSEDYRKSSSANCKKHPTGHKKSSR